MCFIRTFKCIVCEILAQIDNKVPHSTFLIFKITFKIIQQHSNFRTALVITPGRLYDAIHLGSTSVPLNNIENYGKISHAKMETKLQNKF